MKKILIVGYDSYLATGLNFSSEKFHVHKILRPFTSKEDYIGYDYVINFCIQPEHFSQLLSEDEMIDVNIAKLISNLDTTYVFLSSRKVYGSDTKLNIYKETDELKPFDFYSKNKANIENKLQEILGNKLLILRTGNIIGEPANKKNYKTFIGWIQNELVQNGKVTCTINKNSRKDFITKKYWQYAVTSLIDNNTTGIYNIGSNFALTMEELLRTIVPDNLLDFIPQEQNSEQFILDCTKLHNYITKLSQDEFIKECKFLREKLCVGVISK